MVQHAIESPNGESVTLDEKEYLFLTAIEAIAADLEAPLDLGRQILATLRVLVEQQAEIIRLLENHA